MSDIVKGGLRGLLADAVGAPVDLVTPADIYDFAEHFQREALKRP